MSDVIKETIAGPLLNEVKKGKLRWYYVSMATQTEFRGGFHIEARGPAEVVLLMHGLRFREDGTELQIVDPIDTEIVKEIPESMRWRKLSLEEVKSIE